MRIKLKFTKNTEKVPNNLQVVNSYIHPRCLGNNNKYHDSHSNYCISRLLGGEIIDGGRNIEYSDGGYILVTSVDDEFLNKIIMGVLQNTTFGYGMEFSGIDNIIENFYNGWNYFKTTNAGFLLKKHENERIENDCDCWTLNDEGIALKIKEHIINKFGKIYPEIDFSDLIVEINNHPSHKVETIYSKTVKNFVNICQINIHTNKVLAEALYNYGIGQSCGSGFGTIYTTQYNDFYK
jgi:CRISPR-associated endoribonuclease Cas6